MATTTVRKNTDIEKMDMYTVYKMANLLKGRQVTFDAEINALVLINDNTIIFDLRAPHANSKDMTNITVEFSKQRMGDLGFIDARQLRTRDTIEVTGTIAEVQKKNGVPHLYATIFTLEKKAPRKPWPR